MYEMFPDLLKFYYTTLSVALVIGLIVGFGICHAWRSKDDGGQHTQGAAYDACLEDEDEPETEHDAVARRLLESCDFL